MKILETCHCLPCLAIKLIYRFLYFIFFTLYYSVIYWVFIWWPKYGSVSSSHDWHAVLTQYVFGSGVQRVFSYFVFIFHFIFHCKQPYNHSSAIRQLMIPNYVLIFCWHVSLVCLFWEILCNWQFLGHSYICALVMWLLTIMLICVQSF
jgi:hypothetical protein